MLQSWARDVCNYHIRCIMVSPSYYCGHFYDDMLGTIYNHTSEYVVTTVGLNR